MGNKVRYDLLDETADNGPKYEDREKLVLEALPGVLQHEKEEFDEQDLHSVSAETLEDKAVRTVRVDNADLE